MPQRGSDLFTCEIHLLPFREHLVAAHTSGTGGVVVFPSCLWRPGYEAKRQNRGYCLVGAGGRTLPGYIGGDSVSLHDPVVGWEATPGHPHAYESLPSELGVSFLALDE